MEPKEYMFCRAPSLRWVDGACHDVLLRSSADVPRVVSQVTRLPLDNTGYLPVVPILVGETSPLFFLTGFITLNIHRK